MKRFKTYLKLKINEKFSVAGPNGGNSSARSTTPTPPVKKSVPSGSGGAGVDEDSFGPAKKDLVAAAGAGTAMGAGVAKGDGEKTMSDTDALGADALGTAIYGDKDSIERDASIKADKFRGEVESSGRGQSMRDADAEGARFTAAFDAGHQAGGGSEEDLDAIRKGTSSGNKPRGSGNVSIPGVEEGGNISLSGQVPPTYPKQPSASKNSNSGNNETQNQSITLDGPELENGNFASGTYNLNMNQTQKARNSDGTIINQGQEQETRLQGSAGKGDQYYDAGSVDFIGSQRQVNGVNVAQDSALRVDNPRPHPQGDENPLLNTMADRRRGHMTVNLSKTQTDNSNADNTVNPSAAPSAAELVQGSQAATSTATPTATSSPTQSNKPLQPVSYNSAIDENGNDKRTGKPASDLTREIDDEKKDMFSKANEVRATGKTKGTFVGGKLQ